MAGVDKVQVKVAEEEEKKQGNNRFTEKKFKSRTHVESGVIEITFSEDLKDNNFEEQYEDESESDNDYDFEDANDSNDEHESRVKQ